MSATPANVRAYMTGEQKARWVKGFPASTTFGESSYTVGREGNEYYAYCNALGLFFVHTTPQLVFDAIRQDMTDRNITGALIHVKTGTISPVNIMLDRDNTILEGEGWQTFLNGFDGTAITVSADGCQVRDLGCRTTGVSDTIVIVGGNAKVKDVWIWGAGRDGIIATGSNTEIINCLIHDTTRNGVLTTGASDGVKIKECWILSVGLDGVAVSGFNTDVGENYIENVARYGVHVARTDVKIYENEITMCNSGGVFLTGGAAWATVQGNDIWWIGGDGIANSGANSVISDNLLYQWADEPIDNDNADTTVEDNNCGGDVFNSKGCGFGTIMEAIQHQVEDGVIDIPAGIYTENVVVNSGSIILRGEGQSTLITSTVAGTPAVLVTGDYCELENLFAISAFASGTSTIVFSGGIACKANKLLIGYSLEDGLNIFNSYVFIGEEILIDQCLRHGIHVEDSSGVLLVKNIVSNVSGNAFDLSGSVNVVINANFMRAGGDTGVLVGSGCNRTTISSNRIAGYVSGILDFGTNTVSGLNNIG